MPELIWNGKYKDGQLVVSPRIALPFQTVESISPMNAAKTFVSKPPLNDQIAAWNNRLIWGDKKYVLPSLYPEFIGRIKLIYIDPPFALTTKFAKNTSSRDLDEPVFKQPSIIEQKAYYDMYGQDFDLDKYLHWFYETVSLLRDLLSTDGCLYVHCDWRVNSYIRLLLDEVFGSDRHGNEIIWHYQSGGRQKNRFSRKHDSLYLYMRSENWIFNADKVGEVRGREKRNNMKKVIDENGHISYSISSGKKVYTYSEDDVMTPFDVWTDISHIHQKDLQRVGYPSQKPEALLERIIQASSDEGDLVLDCFCGSGTTAVVAEKLKRRWIACDISRFAIHTTRERLLKQQEVHPFVIQNIGNYERQIWQLAEGEAENKNQIAKKQQDYRRFMLDLFRAQPLNNFVWIHGTREGRFVHVGNIDTPISYGDIQALVEELWYTYGKNTLQKVDVLGWDFAFEIDRFIRQIEHESQIKITCRRIPREVLTRRAQEQIDIKFFEMAALDVEVHQGHDRQVTVFLTDFIIPTEVITEEIRQSLHEWHQWIDYWTIDWNYNQNVFHNMIHLYRTTKEVALQTSANHVYEQPGTYIIAVKVIDVLGNDTTTVTKVEVR